MKRSFTVNAVWDEDCGKFISQSDINGLHIEASTIDEFEAIMHDVAAELIVANHMSASDIATLPLRDLVPTIIWQRPALPANA